jgi:hypothetical protein
MLRPHNIATLIATFALLVVLFPRATIGQSSGDRSTKYQAVADSVYGAILMDHLRANFDDIHDVSMRFHHQDHTIGGLLVFVTVWENGMLDSIAVARNDTGNDDLPAALIEKFRTWGKRKPGLPGNGDSDRHRDGRIRTATERGCSGIRYRVIGPTGGAGGEDQSRGSLRANTHPCG